MTTQDVLRTSLEVLEQIKSTVENTAWHVQQTKILLVREQRKRPHGQRIGQQAPGLLD
jgi:hypothetical protein